MSAYILPFTILTIINPLYGAPTPPPTPQPTPQPTPAECTSDYDCAREFDCGPSTPFDVPINDCGRCCGDVCTETEGDECGTDHHETTARTSSYGFNVAACCSGEVCLDNYLGICGIQVGECAGCISWNTQHVDFGDAVERLSNCEDGFICLIDDSPGSDVTMNDINYLNYGYGEFFGEMENPIPPRRRLLDDNDLDFNGIQFNRGQEVKHLRPQVTIKKGICVAEDGISTETSTCSIDNDCPSCMRCCAGNDGNKKCIRNTAGDICGFEGFEGRGPCCCPGTCKSNECITPAPTQSPNDSDDNGGHGGGGGSSDEMFNAEKMVGLTDNNNNSGDTGYMWSLSDKAIINLWAVVLVIFIPTIILGYCCLYKKKGKASFKNDINEMNDV